jgi:multicomponent Na+:H+ antiporter subunit E
MMARLPLALWLVFVWVALWGDLTTANVVGGAAVAGLTLALFPHAGPRPGITIRPLQVIRFLAYFGYKLIEANAIVAWEVLTPNNDSVREAVVAVRVTGASDAVVTILANAISLTPGTLTLDVRRDPTVLFVHVLHLRSIEATRDEVHRLETLVLNAFGDRDAIEAHDRFVKEGY